MPTPLLLRALLLALTTPALLGQTEHAFKPTGDPVWDRARRLMSDFMANLDPDAVAIREITAQVDAVAAELRVAQPQRAAWILRVWAFHLASRCNRVAEAEPIFERAIALRLELGDAFEVGVLRLLLAEAWQGRGEHENCERVLAQASADRDTIPSGSHRDEIVGRIAKLRGRMLADSADWEDALAEALAAADTFGRHEELAHEQAYALQDAAMLCARLERRVDQLAHLQQARRAIESMRGGRFVPRDQMLADVFSRLAVVYSELSRHEDVVEYADLAIATARRCGADDIALWVGVDRAAALARLGRVVEAVGSLEACAAEFARKGKLGEQANCHYVLADLHVEAGRWDEALVALQRAKALLGEQENPFYAGSIAVQAAFCHVKLGNASDAAGLLAEVTEPKGLHLRLATARAAHQVLIGQPAAALVHIRAVLPVVTQLVEEVGRVGWLASLRERGNLIPLLQAACDALARLESPEPSQVALVYSLLLQLKRVATNPRVGVPFRGGFDPGMEAELGRRRARLSALLDRRKSLLADRQRAPELESLDREIGRLHEALGSSAEELLAIGDPARVAERRVADVASVQAALPPGHALIELFDGAAVAVFVVHAGGVQFRSVDRAGIRLASADPIGSAAPSGGSTPARGQDPDTAVGGMVKSAQAALWQRIVDRAVELLPRDTSSLWLALDGEFCRVPCDMAEVPGRGPKQRLLERFAIGHVHSGSALLRGKRSGVPSREPRLFALGNPDTRRASTEPAEGHSAAAGQLPPLPHAEREVEEVLALVARLGGNSVATPGDATVMQRSQSSTLTAGAHRVLLREAATEAAIKHDEALRTATIVHLACHGEANPTVPSLSCLHLAPGPASEDGILYRLETEALPLQAELVVLSGCETSAGRIEPLDGAAGLARSLLAGGAQSVLATLWRVQDEASRRLVLSFYDNWLRLRMPRPQALARAKAAALASGAPVATVAAFILWDAPGS